LNRQNQVLQLQRQLGDKRMENLRLYIILSTMVLAFILLWAYKTKRSQLHFMKLSRQDGLTGIFNRPHFIEQSVRALNTAKKSGQRICVAICDLDHFKAINDNCGHATGDAVLKQTATKFLHHLQKQDLVGRLGGEEFGILFVDCDLPSARERCEKLRLALAEIAIEEAGVGAQSRLSASFGISDTTISGHEFRQLLAHADTALYQAKRAGRNRVVLYGQSADNSVIEMDRLTA
jgi:diguanylate cyclase (GGDEF)-like protein